MSADGVVKNAASEAIWGAAFLAIQGLFQMAQAVGEASGSALLFGSTLWVAAYFFRGVSVGLKRHQEWARLVLEGTYWTAVALFLLLAAFIKFVPRAPTNPEFDEFRAFVREWVPPVLLLLCSFPAWGIRAVRRQDVRVLFTSTRAEGGVPGPITMQ